MSRAYAYGQIARERKRLKSANPYPYATRLWAWWMAGWNDKDIEEQTYGNPDPVH